MLPTLLPKVSRISASKYFCVLYIQQATPYPPFRPLRLLHNYHMGVSFLPQCYLIVTPVARLSQYCLGIL